MHQAILGIGQDSTGNWFIRPQLGDLESFEIVSHTPWGKVGFMATKVDDHHECSLSRPDDMPLSIRTVSPLNMPFADLGNEFSHDLPDEPTVKFDIYPYSQNRLIVEPIPGR